MVLSQTCQFLTRASPRSLLFWISVFEFCSQVEGIGGHHFRDEVGNVSCTHRFFHFPGTSRQNTIRENGHHLVPQFLIIRGRREKFFARFLVERHCVHLSGAHVPPTRKNGAGQKAWYQLFPDKSLCVPGSDEILFQVSQNVRQISQ